MSDKNDKKGHFSALFGWLAVWRRDPIPMAQVPEIEARARQAQALGAVVDAVVDAPRPPRR